MGKVLKFRLPDKAASGNVEYEIPVKPSKGRKNLENAVWDSQLEVFFRVLKRDIDDEGVYIYSMEKLF
jgi:hypothetical protein